MYHRSNSWKIPGIGDKNIDESNHGLDSLKYYDKYTLVDNIGNIVIDFSSRVLAAKLFLGVDKGLSSSSGGRQLQDRTMQTNGQD